MIDIIHEQLIARLDNIKRCNGTPLIKEETVSQHSFWVVFYANLLIKDLFYFDMPAPDYKDLYYITIRKALLHDADEIWQGDIIFPTKYHDVVGSTIKDALNKITEHEVEKLKSSLLNDELKDVLLKENKLADMIVKIADWLSLYHFLYSEYILGNKGGEIVRVMNLCEHHLRLTTNKLEVYCIANHIRYDKDAIQSVLK